VLELPLPSEGVVLLEIEEALLDLLEEELEGLLLLRIVTIREQNVQNLFQAVFSKRSKHRLCAELRSLHAFHIPSLTRSLLGVLQEEKEQGVNKDRLLLAHLIEGLLSVLGFYLILFIFLTC